MASAEFITEPNYTVLAHVYDTLMKDVDYSEWAHYLDEVIQSHSKSTRSILELACGTGSLAFILEELGDYKITATDGSVQMVEKAREKAREKQSKVSFRQMDFLNIDIPETFDVIYTLFDSINYLHTRHDLDRLMNQVSGTLNPGGHFIFDFTTPSNSRRAVEYLHNDEGVSPDNYRYFRSSDFSAKERLHINEFEIEKLDETHKKVLNRYVEVHRQKIYTLDDILSVISQTEFNLVATYDSFNFDRATQKSLRVTVVLEWPLNV